MAHLRAGVSRNKAEAEMRTIARRLSDLYPQTNRDWTVQVVPLRDYAIFRGSAPFMMLMMGATGFVLLIACANVANLLFVRATGGQREIAVRAALGATRWRLARQLLSESDVAGNRSGRKTSDLLTTRHSDFGDTSLRRADPYYVSC